MPASLCFHRLLTHSPSLTHAHAQRLFSVLCDISSEISRKPFLKKRNPRNPCSFGRKQCKCSMKLHILKIIILQINFSWTWFRLFKYGRLWKNAAVLLTPCRDGLFPSFVLFYYHHHQASLHLIYLVARNEVLSLEESRFLKKKINK